MVSVFMIHILDAPIVRLVNLGLILVVPHIKYVISLFFVGTEKLSEITIVGRMVRGNRRSPFLQ